MTKSYKSIISVEVSCNPNYVPLVGTYVISGIHKYTWKKGTGGAVRRLVRGDNRVAGYLYPDGSLCLYGETIDFVSVEAVFGFVARVGLIVIAR